ncbi:transposase [Aquimarina addita]
MNSDPVHMQIEYAPKLNVSSIVKSLIGRLSRLLKQEFFY